MYLMMFGHRIGTHSRHGAAAADQCLEVIGGQDGAQCMYVCVRTLRRPGSTTLGAVLFMCLFMHVRGRRTETYTNRKYNCAIASASVCVHRSEHNYVMLYTHEYKHNHTNSNIYVNDW